MHLIKFLPGLEIKYGNDLTPSLPKILQKGLGNLSYR